MSHFSVLVITDHQPTEAELGRILQPWHEFECTGIDDEYVQDIDRTSEALEEYRTSTTTCLRGPDGQIHTRFDADGNWKPEFSKVGEFGQREAFVPAGFTEIEVSTSDVESAAKYISDYYGWGIAGLDDGDKSKYGYVEVDASGNVLRCIDRTNPNKKWDWWVVGGRWSGHLRLKAGASRHALSSDQAAIADVDIDAMRSEARDKALALWDEVHEAIKGAPPIEGWDVVRERNAGVIEKARTEYWQQPGVLALKERFPKSWGLDREVEAANEDRERFGQKAADASLSTFAVVKDGVWHERGEMGRFAFVRDEKSQDDWSAKFAGLLDGLPSTAWLTVVDCHI